VAERYSTERFETAGAGVVARLRQILG